MNEHDRGFLRGLYASVFVSAFVVAALVAVTVSKPEPEPAPTVLVFYECRTDEAHGNATFIVAIELPYYGPWPTYHGSTNFESPFHVDCTNWEGR